jgi:hypothetical protein
MEKTSTGFCFGSSAVILLEVSYDCSRRRPDFSFAVLLKSHLWPVPLGHLGFVASGTGEGMREHTCYEIDGFTRKDNWLFAR